MKSKMMSVLGTLLMSAAILTPALVASSPAAAQVEIRVALPVWTVREEPSYRRYWTERYPERPYVVFEKRDKDEQRAYWTWRHNHPDHD